MNKHVTQMTIDDAEHISPAQRDAIIESYPAHERAARVNGTPSLGSGAIFPVAEENITIESFKIPDHWPIINGMDFGWDHPFAAAQLAWNRDEDVIYVTKAYRQKESTPIMHAAALKHWGDGVWAWPHDGLQHDKGSGVALATQYENQGMNMLPEKATFEDGGNGVEAGIFDMLDRMQSGRWKVFAHLAEWLEEFRMYHRKDGKIVKEFDDLLCASRYALMMLRHAQTATVHVRRQPDNRGVYL